MKTKELIKRAHGFADPFKVDEGKKFRLKDTDPNDTLEGQRGAHYGREGDGRTAG